MAKYAKEYLNRKIENCEKLIENASSQEQKKIYQGYLDFWKKNDSTQKSTPDPAIDKSEEPVFDDEAFNADIFETENAPKQAYYKRNGQWIKTKAFEEFLNKETQ